VKRSQERLARLLCLARWKAARKLGLEMVPVHVAKDLSPDQILALRIAENQTASLSDWDAHFLPIKLSELQNSDYDLSILGFDADTLADWPSGGDEMAEGTSAGPRAVVSPWLTCSIRTPSTVSPWTSTGR
jgi:hypothetical protein